MSTILHEKPDTNALAGIDDPEKLIAWMCTTGRRYVVFHAPDLIRSLPWPEGVEVFQQFVHAYAQQRRTLPVENAPDGPDGRPVALKSDELTLYEVEHLIEQLTRQRDALVAKKLKGEHV